MRRANGTGTITRLPGERRRPYAVRVPDVDRRGHVVQRYLSYHATAQEAQQALDDYNRGHCAAAGQAVRHACRCVRSLVRPEVRQSGRFIHKEL